MMSALSEHTLQNYFSVIFLGIFLSQAFQSFSTILTIFPIFAKGIIIYRELKMKKKLSFLKYTDYPNKVLFLHTSSKI